MLSLFPKLKNLNAAQQQCCLKSLYPSGSGAFAQTRLFWKQTVRPSPFSRAYEIQIEYQPGEYPTTRVLQPNLRSLAGARKIPHIYELPGDPLCLFYAKAREWNSSMSLAATIVPWTCEWLFHFEAWLYTNKWEGGGIHI
jgi:hypothetical protein